MFHSRNTQSEVGSCWSRCAIFVFEGEIFLFVNSQRMWNVYFVMAKRTRNRYVIPFIGAGASCPLLPSWWGILKEIWMQAGIAEEARNVVCNDCEMKTAMVVCQSCNLVLCDPCFEDIHKVLPAMSVAHTKPIFREECFKSTSQLRYLEKGLMIGVKKWVMTRQLPLKS